MNNEGLETCTNIGTMHEVDEFVCSSCGIWLKDWFEIARDFEGNRAFCCEYAFKYCPNCGKKIV